MTWVVLADPEGNEFCVLQSQYEDGNPLAAIAQDSLEPQAQADFWTVAAGWKVVEDDEEGISLANPNGHKPNLDLMRVPEPHTTKNRIHLDVAPPKDADHAAEVDRLLAAGATEPTSARPAKKPGWSSPTPKATRSASSAAAT